MQSLCRKLRAIRGERGGHRAFGTTGLRGLERHERQEMHGVVASAAEHCGICRELRNHSLAEMQILAGNTAPCMGLA